ncbi:hypothetical protein EUGRSUZ_K00255 [Eucalyptus grandis]|uniref:Uncharacterized protein n=1 Tax=Eucalyptus grandis TaxID=71139 RepID=A0ACC3ISH4_EUCGR|nr:hypothetical protein EUGRSUZ_K00255 [Eucalyptus grandis]
MAGSKPQRRVLLLCGDYMEEYEAMVPFQALLAYGVSMDAVCPRKKAGDICRPAVHQMSGAHWVEPESLSHCITDGNLVTGVAYPGHLEFIQSFLKALGGSITGLEKRILFYVSNGCHVDTVCPKKKSGDTCPIAIHDFEGDQSYNEKPGHDFTLTADFEGLDASSYDALVIPRGRAPEYLALDGKVIALVKDFMEAKKPVASIYHGQQILVAAGVLKGKKCTAYPAVKLDVVLAGATWLEPDPIDRCFTDGNLVTRAAWPGHPELIFQLMALLGIKVTF